jgi:rhodanese-related sulfurtransferase
MAGSPQVRDVSLAELKAGLADGSLVVVDVREPHEFAAGHIPGSVSVPLSSFEITELEKAEGKRIVFSCAAGVRSVHALARAQAAGLSLEEHFSGGFKGWVMAGEPIA